MINQTDIITTCIFASSGWELGGGGRRSCPPRRRNSGDTQERFHLCRRGEREEAGPCAEVGGESRVMVTFTGIGTESLCSSSDSRCTLSEGLMQEEGTQGRGENTFYIEKTYYIPDYIPGHGAGCAGPSSRGPGSSTYR